VRLLKAFGSVYRSILDATAMTMMAMSTIAVLTSDVDTRARITQIAWNFDYFLDRLHKQAPTRIQK
jgi:hypothetical protein